MSRAQPTWPLWRRPTTTCSTPTRPLATARARTVAAANGYTHGTGGVVVNVTITIDNGAEAQVDISAPHHNNFASIVGMPTWAVATTAKAQAGYPDTANGAGPIIFSIDAFGPSGQPLAAYGDKNHPYDFGETNGDIPSGPGDIAWTNYGTGNVDSNGVRRHHRRATASSTRRSPSASTSASTTTVTTRRCSTT